MKYLKVWTDFGKVLEPLADDEKGRLFVAMLQYAAYGSEPQNFKGNERFLWAVAKRDIDTMQEKAETWRANGSKGGRPNAKDNQTEPNETKDNQTEPNESLKEKKRKEKKGNENKRNIFEPPTLEEVSAYCKERKNGIDPEYWFDYQVSRNWVLSNGKKMCDWKAVIRTWEKNGLSKGRLKAVPAQQYAQRDYSNEQEDAMRRMVEMGGA